MLREPMLERERAATFFGANFLKNNTTRTRARRRMLRSFSSVATVVVVVAARLFSLWKRDSSRNLRRA